MGLSWEIYLAFFTGLIVAGVVCWVIVYSRLKDDERRFQETVGLAKKEAQIKAKEVFSEEQISFEYERSRLQQQWKDKGLSLELKDESLKQLEVQLRAKENSLEDRNVELKRKEEELSRRRYGIDNLRQLYRRRLLQLTHLTEEEAQARLKDEVRSDCEEEIRVMRENILGRSRDSFEEEAKRVVLDTIQRLGGVVTTDISSTNIKLPSDEVKGRLIGREGRNIKCFENATGTSLVIDETPEMVMVASFDPVRREVAATALNALVKDGRIHPANIEEFVKKAEEQIAERIERYADQAITKLGLKDISKSVLTLVGKLYYRLSNNQNTLDHSVEVAFLCSLIASELKLDANIAKRCGLFHDMGKCIPHEQEDSHALAAAKMLKNEGEDDRVVNAVAAHHEEVPETSIYAVILKIADALSAQRPGARSDTMEGYIKRIHSLEKIVSEFEGVQDSYVIQAGREVRVIVSPGHYDDAKSSELARQIRKRIEEDMQYPHSIKVTVIREQRFVEVAK